MSHSPNYGVSRRRSLPQDYDDIDQGLDKINGEDLETKPKIWTALNGEVQARPQTNLVDSEGKIKDLLVGDSRVN